jgi:hypothetical protein
LILKDAILENLFWPEPNIVRTLMGAHSSENCHSQTDKILNARLWTSTPLRTIISENLINDGNKKSPNIVRAWAKENPLSGI